MTQSVDELLQQYPGASVWAFGDNAALADELATLVIQGKKTATTSSLASFQHASCPVLPGSYHIVLNSRQLPVCVIRLHSLGLIRFCDVSEALAAMEGEGDLSLDTWRQRHRAFFSREGHWSEEMELVFQTFRLVSVIRASAHQE